MAPPFGYTGTTTQVPEWYEKTQHRGATGAINVSNMPYRAYPYSRLQRHPEQALPYQQYFRMMNHPETMNQYQPHFTRGQAHEERSVREFPEEAERYMLPYLEGAIGNLSHQADRQLMERWLPNIGARAIGMGQFGSTVHRNQEARARRDMAEAFGREKNNLLHGAYQAAMGAHGRDRARDLAASQQAMLHGRQAQASHFADMAAQQGFAGEDERLRAQGEAVRRREFQEEQEHPVARAAQFSAMANGIPVPGISQFSGTAEMPQRPPQPNVMAGLTNVLGQLGSPAFSGNTHAKRGGYFKERKSLRTFFHPPHKRNMR